MVKFRKTRVKMSDTLSPIDVGEMVREASELGSHRYEVVPHNKLRATVATVIKGYKPGSKPRPSRWGLKGPTGVKLPDGTVHLSDGHHRADEAVRKKKSLGVHVVDADYEDFE